METKSARRFAPTHLGAIAVLSAMLSMAGFAILVSPANAKPEYLDAFNQKYSTRGSKLDSCNTCHTTTQDAQHLNPYGTDFHNSNRDFGAIEPKDSDGDGFSNIDEIHAGTFPGDPNDNPKTKSAPKPSTTTTTAKSGPLSLIGLPSLGSTVNLGQLLSILDGQ
jgi:hypothetical protein